MENKQFPQQEPEEILPEKITPVPAEPEESLPVIEELTFAQEPAFLPEQSPEEKLSDEEEPAMTEEPAPLEDFPAEEALPLVEEIPVMEVFPAEEEAFTVADSPAEANEAMEPISFMDRIPDVDDDPIAEEPAPPQEEAMPDLPESLSEPEPEAALPESIPELPEDTVNSQEAPEQDEAAPAAPSSEQATPVQERTTRKGRPKRKKGEGLFGIPNILATIVWLGLVVAIGVTLGRMLWVCVADVLAFGREDKEVTITIYEADSMENIVDKLYDAGLIRYKSLFNLYASISDAEEDIKPGIYDLNTRYDYHALVNFMSPSSTRSVVELTIPEGYTCRQIFALLEENRVCTTQDIAAYAADGELDDYWFLENVARGSEYCLEGFLFPDTYQFYKNSSPREALEKMLDNFDYRFTEEMRAQIDTLNANVTDGSFTVNDVVIVASLIEKESAAAEESPKIAGVIYNRLYNWEYPALLNIDAAIIYAQGGESSVIDTSIDSPYNTYRYTGLTPTAIANPGLSSLQAALNPAEHNYYFYLLNPSTGMHQFSTTQAEHDALIAQFYN